MCAPFYSDPQAARRKKSYDCNIYKSNPVCASFEHASYKDGRGRPNQDHTRNVMSHPNPRHSTEIDSASFESLIIFPSLSDLIQEEVALLVFHPLRIVSPPSAPRFGNAEMTLFLHCQDEINRVFVVVANLTVTDPLRIQLWSQDRMSKAKSRRKNDGEKIGQTEEIN